ncbi:AraC family transcriptional regulator [Sphingopyxis sp. EG6]|jgi:AraC-like DNA-binding protein|uniref:AraC family transcriptional regulator n=1 Tax=Sphingopyxis sp. EG6 TaxID=1874061 RepID=UPI000DC640D5|nr:AraC family transcriptional regulator [Sphingopyxis sp. EG6]BBB08695.1 AraC family transcriptional regulator [Sphingopyxis sp. EG6]
MATSSFDTILSALSVEIEAFAICDITADVGLIFPPADAIEVHHILEGTLYLSVDKSDPIELGAGSMVIVPPGRQQRLAASPNPESSKIAADVCIPARDGLMRLKAASTDRAVLRLACGTVHADPSGFYGPLEGLSRPIAEDLSDLPLVSAAFAAMLEEAAMPSDGAMALTSALMKACLVLLLRRHIRSGDAAVANPGLFRDPRLARTLAIILDRPAARHSVTSMAKEAGMSRSAFSREFKLRLGMTPMEFVAGVRLDLSRRLLVATSQSVERVAAHVGFRSRSHFSQQFRNRYGSDPTSFRSRKSPDGR